jgi:hypothetical protein
MSETSKKRYGELLNELSEEQCSCKYCFLKTFLESLHPDPYVLVQLKCIEKLKWERSEMNGQDIGWNEAGMLWVEEGWAKVFREVFDADLSIKENYRLTKEKIRH